MRTALIATVVALAAALVAAQLLLPRLAEHRVEDRLTERGGTADASISAVPAVRLLLGDGDRLTVTGHGLELDLGERLDVLERLDGFGEVAVEISDTVAGPFAVERFSLTRTGEAPYHLTSDVTTTPADVAGYGAEALGLAGPLAKLAVGSVLRHANAPIPVELEMELASEDGRIDVVSGSGSVAGLPLGPLAELITAAVVARL